VRPRKLPRLLDDEERPCVWALLEKPPRLSGSTGLSVLLRFDPRNEGIEKPRHPLLLRADRLLSNRGTWELLVCDGRVNENEGTRSRELEEGGRMVLRLLEGDILALDLGTVKRGTEGAAR